MAAMKLAEHYASLVVEGSVDADAMEALWREWLWDTPCNATPTCADMNRNQGVGLFLCVALSYEADGADDIPSLLPNSPLVHLVPGPISAWTQRQLMDQIECLQLYWGQVMGAHEVSLPLVCSLATAKLKPSDCQELDGRCEYMLRRMMARAGVLARHAYTPNDGTLVSLDCL